MPVYDYRCKVCKETVEVVSPMDAPVPTCCCEVMTRLYKPGSMVLKMGYPGFVDRIDDIHKAQEQRGERLRLPHPKEVGAT